jgi:uncharacterized protein (TIGR02996 family)
VTLEAQWRAGTLEHFRKSARRTFEERPELRSILFAVAQYWNDQADDEVHDLVVASPRDVPGWPHYCEMYSENVGLVTAGDRCNQNCDLQLPDVGVSPDTFARFCHEFGSQDRDDGENFTPYAIARRRGEGDALDVELEFVARLWRPEDDLVPDEPEAAPRWLELPRANDLYEQVCANPADDEPRRVLADYLLERGHPRGELIALSLARRDELPAEALARRDELLETYGRQWQSPLGSVLPESGARWERGFLARADVYIRFDPAELAGAPVWGTLEQIRFLRRDFLDPAMIALRDVGPLREGLRALPKAKRPWAIERLHAVLGERGEVDALWRARTLPRLRHLVLEGGIDAALERPRPPWWPQLERLTLILDCDTQAAQLEACRRRYAGLAPWVAVTRRSSLTCDLGWEIATGPGGRIELSLAGWHEAGTPFAAWELIDALPRELDVWLAPSQHWAPIAEDAERLAVMADRPVRIAPR